MESLGLEAISLLGDRCKMPDHSIVMLSFQMRVNFNKDMKVPESQTTTSRSQIRRFPKQFLATNACNINLLGLTDQMNLNTNDQDHTDV